MHYAILNGDKVEPQKGLRAVCPNCGAIVIAKCGTFRVDHWAHLSKKMCDPWWETETEWHRNWKNEFPKEWQEISLLDANTKEKHIADLKTAEGTVVEFQHSPITEQERISREDFYLATSKRMIWVLDCSDRSFSFMFFQGFDYKQVQAYGTDIELKWIGRGKLFDKWGGSKAFVLLDFGNDTLWWLKNYDPISKKAIVNARKRAVFIEKTLESK